MRTGDLALAVRCVMRQHSACVFAYPIACLCMRGGGGVVGRGGEGVGIMGQLILCGNRIGCVRAPLSPPISVVPFPAEGCERFSVLRSSVLCEHWSVSHTADDGSTPGQGFVQR